MKLSAMTFALILTAIQQPALGEDLVIAEGDEYATEQVEMGPQIAPIETKPSADGTEEIAQFERLFGNVSAEALSSEDQAVVSQARAIAWPWWLAPLGLFTIGVLLVVRSRVNRHATPVEAIKVISRQSMGKDGSIALIEVHDGDCRKRRLLVGLGGGAPRLVADVSAWDVAVAAPSNIENQAVAVVGPQPDIGPTMVQEIQRPDLHLASFDGHLAQAAARYAEAPAVVASNKRDLIDEVMAKRDQVRQISECDLDKTGQIREARRKPRYSSREVLA